MDSKSKISNPNCYLFDAQYASLQKLEQLHLFQENDAQLAISIVDQIAYSLPKSPIGGVFTTNADKEDLFHLLEKVTKQLQGKAKQIQIKQPISIYPAYSKEALMDFGFQQSISEISHYVELNNQPVEKLHEMQQRKLKSTEFSVAVTDPGELPLIYQCITEARKAQDLDVNTTLKNLQDQFKLFPNQYLIYTAYKEQFIAATCIVTLPTNNIAYYYLPATNPLYRTESPMVPLMAYMYDDLLKRGYDYLDLGISSINGVPQTSLIAFKERMAGIRTERPNLILTIK